MKLKVAIFKNNQLNWIYFSAAIFWDFLKLKTTFRGFSPLRVLFIISYIMNFYI